MPTQGFCDVAFAFHIDQGSYGNVSLAGLNAGMIGHVDGPMGGGNWKVALYVDEKGSAEQRDALQGIFAGAVGGPMGAFAPLVGEVLGVKSAPIDYVKDGKKRSVRIGGFMEMAVEALPSMKPDGSEASVSMGHPFAPDWLALASGQQGSRYNDYGMSWDNSGKNGHYAPIAWSGP